MQTHTRTHHKATGDSNRIDDMKSPREYLRGLLSPGKRARGDSKEEDRAADDSSLATTLRSMGDRTGLTLADVTGKPSSRPSGEKEEGGPAGPTVRLAASTASVGPSGAGETVAMVKDGTEAAEGDGPPPLRIATTKRFSGRTRRSWMRTDARRSTMPRSTIRRMGGARGLDAWMLGATEVSVSPLAWMHASPFSLFLGGSSDGPFDMHCLHCIVYHCYRNIPLQSSCSRIWDWDFWDSTGGKRGGLLLCGLCGVYCRECGAGRGSRHGWNPGAKEKKEG